MSLDDLDVGNVNPGFINPGLMKIGRVTIFTKGNQSAKMGDSSNFHQPGVYESGVAISSNDIVHVMK